MDHERYEEIAPPPSLRPFVRTIWTYATPTPSGAVQRIAPDGCPELIIHLGRHYEERGASGLFKPQSSVVFAGQFAQPLTLRPTGSVELVAVRFEPDGARDFLRAPMAAATDRRLDFTNRLAGLTLVEGDPATQVATTAAWLDRLRVDEDWSLDPQVRAAIEGRASPSPDSAARRALQRRFRDRVGVSLQTLRSIQRFRRVFDHAADPATSGEWLRAGLAAGYFDQPQMARDFRRFLGCSATHWAREQAELALHIASSSYKTDGAP